MKNSFLLIFLFITLNIFAQNQVPGTKVTAPIVPNDLRDEYPTHIDKYGKGGYRVVATKGERDSIKSSLRDIGMLVHVKAADSTFRLTANPAFPDDVTQATWVNWIDIKQEVQSNYATYILTKGTPPDNYIIEYPFKQVRTPIYFDTPFTRIILGSVVPSDLYYMRINCYNERGTVPYLIVERKPDYFSLDVSESCTCSWEAKAIESINR